MAVTKSDTVYRELLERIRSACAVSPDQLVVDRISISPVLTFRSELVRPAVELIVPGDAQVPDVVGGVGLVRENFEVAVVRQIARDSVESWTHAIAHEVNGILPLINAIRGTGKQGSTGLINFQPHSALSVCRFRGWRTVQQHPEDPWAIAWVDRYDLDYEVGFE